MPIRSTRLRSALALAGALLGVAPGARKLTPRVGHPIPYLIALPEGAEIDEAPGLLSARTGDLVVVTVARDMLEDAENPAPVPAESRRRFTSMLMRADSLLFRLLEEELQNRNLKLHDASRRVRTLGGQWAAWIRGRLEENGLSGWIDIHATVKDGILYMLVFTMSGGDPRAHDPLLASIHDSFVLPR